PGPSRAGASRGLEPGAPPAAPARIDPPGLPGRCHLCSQLQHLQCRDLLPAVAPDGGAVDWRRAATGRSLGAPLVAATGYAAGPAPAAQRGAQRGPPDLSARAARGQLESEQPRG